MLKKTISTALHEDEETCFNEKVRLIKKTAGSNKSRTLFETLRALTNQRSTISEWQHQ